LSYPGLKLDETAHGIKGLTIDVEQVGSQTVTIQPETKNISDQMSTLWKALNQLAESLHTHTKPVLIDGQMKPGTLSGDPEMASLFRTIRFNCTTFQGDASTGHMTINDLGIHGSSNPQDVKFVFDLSVFQAKLTEDPQKVINWMQQFAQSIEKPLSPYHNRMLRIPAGYTGSIDRFTQTPQNRIQKEKMDKQNQINRLRQESTTLTNKIKAQQDHVQLIMDQYNRMDSLLKPLMKTSS